MKQMDKEDILRRYERTPDSYLPDIARDHRNRRVFVLTVVATAVGLIGWGLGLYLFVLGFRWQPTWGWGQPLIFIGIPLACASLVTARILTKPSRSIYMPTRTELAIDLKAHRDLHGIGVQLEPTDRQPTPTGATSVSVVFALMNLGYIVWVGTLPWYEAEVLIARIFLGTICCLFATAIISFTRGKVKRGAAFMIAGGVLNIPVGLVALFVGRSALRRARRFEEEAIYQTNASGTIGGNRGRL